MDAIRPKLIYGKIFDDQNIAINEIDKESIKPIVVTGKVFDREFRILKNRKALLTFAVNDYLDSIKVKLFIEQKHVSFYESRITEGTILRIRGNVVFDTYDKELTIQKVTGIIVEPEFEGRRVDTAQQKRVELHCHTKMSAMDGVSSAADIVRQAYKWGMQGIAITDHAVVQSLPEAYHAVPDTDNFKLILGVEGYLVDIDPEYFGQMDRDERKKIRSYHVIIIVQNEAGRINLYKLISESHLNYFYRRPLIPRSLLIKYREGLIIGSACCAGELYCALLERRSEEGIRKIVDFYDYLEIQPLDNNRFMINSECFPYVNSERDLKAINAEIVKLGENCNKRVVATSDAHFLNPEDEIFRDIILSGIGMEEEPASLYLRTTDEMLDEFSYLGEEKAREVVIENTNKILNLCDHVSPVRPDKCPPVIENSDEILKKICLDKAHELYGDHLPEIVSERLEKELSSVIGNGYSVMYIIAQKLVERSLREGYLVGSRGSVGSSFAAYTAGITEVNPLPPHYLCPNCKHSDFSCEEVTLLDGNSGCDLPDKTCPICGSAMSKQGFNIPFETFLGFEGDKEPDIDLNFSGEIQESIHQYTKEIFGNENCFKGGTISSLAGRSAYGFVMRYLEKNHITKRQAEIQRLVDGCLGIKRGTGQHPGGIVILPRGEDINSFTPIQYPADDSDSSFITTHFDYHSIDHNLLKLDILGHDDPTMLRFLQKDTGVDPHRIPLDDNKVMQLFKDVSALGITPEQIGGVKLGCLGIPEFGTDFAMSMVAEAKPQSFSDLMRLSGLAHGTDVWLGNAKELISSGTADIKSCICCRDDIMSYLIQKGIEKKTAFKVMEAVRKGKVANGKESNWEEWKELMIKKGIPEWYTKSCEKIKYMFPKAHAAAYVMMAWRIAYYKIYYPQEFYCAWFSIRANTLNYEKMFRGKEILKIHLEEYRSCADSLSASEKDEYTAMRIAEEMYERGIDICPIDFNVVDSTKFKVVGDKIMPSLVSIGGLGGKAAEQIINAAKDTPFISKDDFKDRTRCPQQVYENMVRLGLLNELPDSDQISLFDDWY